MSQPSGASPNAELDRIAAFGRWLQQAEGRQAVRDLVARDLPVLELTETLYDLYRARNPAA